MTKILEGKANRGRHWRELYIRGGIVQKDLEKLEIADLANNRKEWCLRAS